MAMVEAPEAVIGLAQKIKTLQIHFLDEWFRRYGKGFVAHYPDYYLPQGASMSVDEIGAVNERMFERFFLPELADLAERYGGLGVHSCANNCHQWENFKRIPGLKFLNINPPIPSFFFLACRILTPPHRSMPIIMLWHPVNLEYPIPR